MGAEQIHRVERDAGLLHDEPCFNPLTLSDVALPWGDQPPRTRLGSIGSHRGIDGDRMGDESGGWIPL